METNRIIYNLYFYSIQGIIQLNDLTIVNASSYLQINIALSINRITNLFYQTYIDIDNTISDQIYQQKINNKYAS